MSCRPAVAEDHCCSAATAAAPLQVAAAPHSGLGLVPPPLPRKISGCR